MSAEPYSLLCSACYTPCSGPEAHVIPHWKPALGQVLTTYRCDNCWREGLAELRSELAMPEVRLSYCDFLTRHGYSRDADTIRAAPPQLQQTYLERVSDAVLAGQLVFDP